jgi:hypothetical protein
MRRIVPISPFQTVETMKHPSLKLVHAALLAMALSACSTATPTGSARARVPALASPLAPMPEAVTSFGAVTTPDGWLYVSGGHRGERHDYNAAMVSGSNHRLNLAEGRTWERLADTPPAQGLALVEHRGTVIRIGGMAARNAPGTKQDLISTADVLRFVPARGTWEKLPSLPAPRSSLDAVVIEDRLYVGGGWSLSGGTNAPLWPDTLLVLDLGRPGRGWREVPQPFRRRALALAALGQQIYFLGGMDSDGKPTLAVDVYDVRSGKWSQGPELPAGKFKGFACSAATQSGRVFVNLFQGDLLRLSADGRAWEKTGRLGHPRMAHRLVAAGPDQLIALGGEDGETKRPDLECLTPTATPEPMTAAR